MASKTVLMYVLTPEYEGRDLVGMTCFVEPEHGRMMILGRLDVAPFDTAYDIGVWVGKMLSKFERMRLR